MARQGINLEEDKLGDEPVEINRRILSSNNINKHRFNRTTGHNVLVGFICGIIFSVLVFYCFPEPLMGGHNTEKKSVLPRQTSTLTDWGHSNRFHGWVDVQRQGVANDYVRYVGPSDEYSFIWLSVALAGATNQYTSPGLYEEHGGIVRRTKVKPRQIIRDIEKLGLPNYFKGWVDAQHQGVANDYAYYIGPTDDIPFPWLTVALAGSSEQQTCPGLYMEKYGVVQPTLGKQHYQQSVAISCQHWASKIRQFLQAPPNFDIYDLNHFSNHSQVVDQYVIVETFVDKNTTNNTTSTLWRQLLPGDILLLIQGIQNGAICNTFSTQLLAAMLVLVALHNTFRFTKKFSNLVL